MRGRFLDPAHPFFRPLWVRVAVVAFALGWAAVELYNGSPGWATLFGAAGLYALWVFVTDKGQTPPDDDRT